MDEERHIVNLTPSAEELSALPKKEIPCPVEGCRSILAQSTALRFHLINTHKQMEACPGHKEVEKRFFCPVERCIRHQAERWFTSYKLLKQHYMKSHAEKSFICLECDACFSVDRDLQRHKRIDCGRTFNCPDCCATFKQRILLLTHCNRKQHRFPDEHQFSQAVKRPANLKHTIETSKTVKQKLIPKSSSEADPKHNRVLLPKPMFAIVPCDTKNNHIQFSKEIYFVHATNTPSSTQTVQTAEPQGEIPILPKEAASEVSSQTDVLQTTNTSTTQTLDKNVAQTQTAGDAILQTAILSAQIPSESRGCQVSPRAKLLEPRLINSSDVSTSVDLLPEWNEMNTANTQTETMAIIQDLEARLAESISTQTQESCLNIERPDNSISTGTDSIYFDLASQTTQTVTPAATQTANLSFDDLLNVNMETQTNSDDVFDLLLSNMETQTTIGTSHIETQTLSDTVVPSIEQINFETQTPLDISTLRPIQTQTLGGTEDARQFLPDLQADMQTQTALSDLFASDLTNSHTQTMLQDLFGEFTQ